MILSTHFIVGAAVAGTTSNEALLLVLPLVSHFILDSFPHWEYIDEIKELKHKPWHLFFDIVAGPAITLITLLLLNDFSVAKIAWVIIGGIIGILPDGLVFLGYLFFPKNKIFQKYESFHRFIHSKKKLAWEVGATQQIVIFILAIFLLASGFNLQK